MNDTETAKQIAWEAFCQLHPHEAHEYDAEKFWTYFQTVCPGPLPKGPSDAIKAAMERGAK